MHLAVSLQAAFNHQGSAEAWPAGAFQTNPKSAALFTLERRAHHPVLRNATVHVVCPVCPPKVNVGWATAESNTSPEPRACSVSKPLQMTLMSQRRTRSTTSEFVDQLCLGPIARRDAERCARLHQRGYCGCIATAEACLVAIFFWCQTDRIKGLPPRVSIRSEASAPT